MVRTCAQDNSVILSKCMKSRCDFSLFLVILFPTSDWNSFSSVQINCSVVSNSLRPHEPQHTGPPVHHQLPESTQTHVHWVSDAIQSSHPLSPPSLPAPNPSQHQGFFSNESVLWIRWPKYCFSFTVSPSNEHLGLISFRMDWLDLLVVQGMLKSLFQHHSSKASILRHSAFFIVQLTPIHEYWKNHIHD